MARLRADEDIGPYEDGRTICVGRDDLGAPYLPPGGKVARPKAVTDEVFPSIRPVR